MTAKWADEGATWFKAYEHLTREELGGVIAEAHERGLKVTGHLCAVTFSEAVDLGIDNLEHGIWVATDFVADKQPDTCPRSDVALGAVLSAEPWVVRKLIDKLVGRRVAVTSTLPVFETFLSTRQPAPQMALDLMSPESRERHLQHRAEIAAAPTPVWGQLLLKEMAFELAFVRAGGLLVAGSDPTGHGGVVAGFSNQREIKLLVEAGFKPVEAIRIATLNGARLPGLDREIGSIAPGKRADLVVVRGNPEELISDIEDVEIVFRDGIGHDPVRLMDSVRGSWVLDDDRERVADPARRVDHPIASPHSSRPAWIWKRRSGRTRKGARGSPELEATYRAINLHSHDLRPRSRLEGWRVGLALLAFAVAAPVHSQTADPQKLLIERRMLRVVSCQD